MYLRDAIEKTGIRTEFRYKLSGENYKKNKEERYLS